MENYDESPIRKRSASGMATTSRLFEQTTLQTSAYTATTWNRSAKKTAIAGSICQIFLTILCHELYKTMRHVDRN